MHTLCTLDRRCDVCATTCAPVQVPVGHIIAPGAQLAELQAALRSEHDFLVAKDRDLAASLLEGRSDLTAAHLAGVTYGRDGLGGAYGGAPRAAAGPLAGAEVTDLGDSWLQGETDTEKAAAGGAESQPQKRARADPVLRS
jgi:hypothetical protein